MTHLKERQEAKLSLR